jgi:diguanylate cyclase (GGDEF)-like protein
MQQVALNVPARLRIPIALALFVFACGLAGMPGLKGIGNSLWVYDVLLLAGPLLCIARAIRDREERAVWLMFAAGMLSYVGGDIYTTLSYSDLAEPPFPSPADALWLGLFPWMLAAVWLLARKRLRGINRRIWLDGLIVGLGLGAVSASIVFRKVVEVTDGDTLTVMTNLAYPAADLLAVIVIAVLLSAVGTRADRTWRTLAAGIGLFLITDSVYLLQISQATYVDGGLLDLGWPLAVVLIGVAAWQPAATSGQSRADDSITLPIALVLVCVALLTYDHFVRQELLAVVLAALTVVAAAVRLLVTSRARNELLRVTHEASMTDELTQLGNRAKLLTDLGTVLRDGVPTLLAFFDLDGFKNYNDTYGHPAGDDLLRRLGDRLAGAMEPGAEAYRMGGDEFCALIPWSGTGAADIERAVAAPCAALAEQGRGFAVTTSWGHALIPEEATSASVALSIADHRLYEDKTSGRVSAMRQAQAVLKRVLDERDEMLGIHMDDVSRLAEQTAIELGLDALEVEHVVLSAELHDIGKSAIPDAILFKPGPLTDEEWTFMRRHAVIGERILSGAPSMAVVASVVRSSHERFDGRGYPDGLAGEDIPLASRIVFVCDAFDAMTSERPYSTPKPPALALGELQACAGTQFDPVVVDAFLRAYRRAQERPHVATVAPAAAT